MAEIVLIGHADDIQLIMRCVLNYNDLSNRVYSKIVSSHDIDFATCQINSTEHYELTTKYYSAKLTLNPFPISDVTNQNLQNQTSNIEGFIMIYSNHLKFNSLIEATTTFRQESKPGFNLLLRIQEATVNNEKDEEEISLWAIDHGFEYIPIDPTNLMESHDEREKYGLPRMMEAMQSNMWSTMERKSSNPKIQSKRRNQDDPLESHDSIEKKVDQNDDVKEEDVNPIQFDSQDDKTIQEEIINDHFDDHSWKDEDALDSFGVWIEKAKSMRDEVINGNLSDKDRRERAEEFAMQLSKFMELDEEDDEDDD